MIEQASTGIEIDEKVQITVRSFFTTRYGADDPNISSTVPPRGLEDLRATFSQPLVNGHERSIRQPGPGPVEKRVRAGGQDLPV